jgi:bifunctional non-homologous end joining protein LigD
MSTRTFEFNGRSVEVGNADKVLFPDIDLTEGQLAGYYSRVADTILPHLRGRPISMQRFPNGVNKPGFYAKQAPEYFPEWIDRVTITVLESGERQPQVVINNPETLIYLVDQACITPHTWLSRTADLHHPDKLIFDLDPPKTFESARAAARQVRALLDELELPAYLMTTGSRGLHVGVLLDGQSDFDTVRDFARDLADALAARHPDQLTTETRKAQRRGRLFLDYLRNAYAQTSVPPYAVRARPGAPVATPLAWDELDDPDLDARRYHVGNVLDRIARVGDPWADFYKGGISLTAARRRLNDVTRKSSD